MTDDSLGRNIGVRDIIGPEFMPRIGADAVDDVPGRAGRLAFTDEKAHQGGMAFTARLVTASPRAGATNCVVIAGTADSGDTRTSQALS
jgi:hypothetical protein